MAGYAETLASVLYPDTYSQNPWVMGGRAVMQTQMPQFENPWMTGLAQALTGLAGGAVMGYGMRQARGDQMAATAKALDSGLLGEVDPKVRAALTSGDEASQKLGMALLSEEMETKRSSRALEAEIEKHRRLKEIEHQNALELQRQKDAADVAAKNAEKAGKPLEYDKVTEQALKELNAVSEKGRKLEQLGGTLEQAAGEAGYTGIGGDYVSSGLRALSLISGDAEKATKARGILEGLQSEIVSASRDVGAGGTSDLESGMYLRSGPLASRSKEENLLLAQTMKARGARERAYADFLTKQARQGVDLSTAKERWKTYEQKFPLLVPGDSGLSVNSKVPSIDDFLLQAQQGAIQPPPAPEAPQPAGTAQAPTISPADAMAELKRRGLL